MKKITLNISKASSFLQEGAVKVFETQVKNAHEALEREHVPETTF